MSPYLVVALYLVIVGIAGFVAYLITIPSPGGKCKHEKKYISSQDEKLHCTECGKEIKKEEER